MQVSVVVLAQRVSVVVLAQVSVLAMVQATRRETMMEGVAGAAWTQVRGRSNVKESMPMLVASSRW